MRESNFWRTPRFITLIIVAGLHVGLIALLWMADTAPRIPGSSRLPLELLYIPATPPPVRADSGRPRKLRADIALSPATPMLTSAPPASVSSGTGSRGLGIDWLAEAHRAVKAYEIRRDAPRDNALSARSPANDWWPQQGPHAAGDQYKNDAGDWIVWIDADCYKVASWHSADPAASAGPAQVVCPKKSGISPDSP